MIWLQITANAGPAECCLPVTKALAQLGREAQSAVVRVSVVEQLDGSIGGTLRSVLVEMDGPEEADAEAALAAHWCGSIQWICESPYRKLRKRKNWFQNGAAFAPPAVSGEFGEIHYGRTGEGGSAEEQIRPPHASFPG